jgi:hypothetical protein
MAVYEPHGVHELLFIADQHQMIGAMIHRHYKRCFQADISRFYDRIGSADISASLCVGRFCC